jgi:uncharacterized protein
MTDPSAFAAAALYAGLNGLILAWLAVAVGRVRMRAKVSVGDGGHPMLIRAMRGQANFVELVPMTLLLMFALAFLGTQAWVLHVLGVALTAGRAMHALHFVQEDAPRWQRAAGATLSFAVLGLAAFGVVGHALAGL